MQAETRDALIGHTGFVGGNLQRQAPFAERYRSTDIPRIEGQRFDTIVCAGAPGGKWRANRDPDADTAYIRKLTHHLRGARCRQFILISTVDVFANPVGVDETSAVELSGLNPYGLHRHQLEQFAQCEFERTLVVRLTGLVGPGLTKNALFDLHNARGLDALDGRAVYQFYAVNRLWRDIQVAIAAGLSLVHLTAEPVGIAELARDVFGIDVAPREGSAARYDLRSRHAGLFGGRDGYTVDRDESLAAIRAYAASEPRSA